MKKCTGVGGFELEPIQNAIFIWGGSSADQI